jgi:hypothetical protein
MVTWRVRSIGKPEIFVHVMFDVGAFEPSRVQLAITISHLT